MIFSSLHENLDTTPGGRLVFHVGTLYNHMPDLRELRAVGRTRHSSHPRHTLSRDGLTIPSGYTFGL